MAKLQSLSEKAISIGAGAVYPYSEDLLDLCSRESKFGSPYSMCRVMGHGDNRRIMVPRRMAPGTSSDLRVPGLKYKFNTSFVPRSDEQSRIITETVALLAKGHNFMLEAPTGFGKTWCAADIIAKIGKKTLIIVTKEDIRDQWIAAFEKLLGLSVGNGIGLIQGDICSTSGAGVVIAMVQSIAKEERYPEHIFKEFGLVIWDECHRVAADYFSQSAFRVPGLLRLGISATPDRKDGKEEVLYAHIGPVLVRTELAPMTPRVIAQRSPWEIPYKRKMLADKSITMVPLPHSAGKCGHIIRIMANFHPRNMVIATFVGAAYKKGRTILVQSDRRDHLDTLKALITSQGVPSGAISYYVGGLSFGEREDAKTKRVILATYAMTAEATDIPELDTLVMATPKSDVRQIVGRILRFLDGKKEPVVFDLIDDTSAVFNGYWGSRKKWYASVGALVEKITS